jgi:predicted MPP superfamily phosphohydrolase
MLVNGGIRVERHHLNLESFGRDFAGLRVVQLSDLHVKRFAGQEKHLVRLVNREEPHFIFLTGDLIENYTDDFGASIRLVNELKAVCGTYAVLGNADHTLRPESRFNDFTNALRQANVAVLINSNVQLSYGHRKFSLAGVDDPFFQFDDFDLAARGLSFDEPTILLSHSPDILLRRADALVVNLLDSGNRKDYFKTWGWATSSYFSPERGELFFEQDGGHTLRIQSRQEGVSLDVVLLNPYPELDEQLALREVGEIEECLQVSRVPDRYSDLMVIYVSSAEKQRCHGKWKKSPDRGAVLGHRMEDLPARRGWQYQPVVEPSDYFEIDFAARRNVRYRLWMRMKAFNGNPLCDSVYVQFSDARDESGRKRYRVGVPAHSKEHLGDVDLILTGHTHGGQIRIPIHGALETLTALGRRYAAGMHRVGRSLLYVSRGIGCSKLPIRFLCPPEVTVFTFGV